MRRRRFAPDQRETNDGGGPGRGAAAEAKGVVFHRTQRFRTGGDNLYPQKARLLLLLALAFSDQPHQIDSWLKRYGALEFGAPERRPTREPRLRR